MSSIIRNCLYWLRLAGFRCTTSRDVCFCFSNGVEFTRIYQEVFVDQTYRFDADTPSPFILDCGAHIGVSVLYFKTRYPHARIVAFEPNPSAFKLLATNLRRNGVSDVELVNAAVADTEGSINFYTEKGGRRRWTWGGAGVKNAWQQQGDYRTIRVPAVRLSSSIDRDVDLLKLDVEGMESVVLDEIEHRLGLVKALVVEFHGSSTNPRNSLEHVLDLLTRNGFDYALSQEARPVTLDQLERTDPFWLVIHAKRR